MNTHDELIKIYSGAEVQAHLIKSELEKIGITCIIRDEFQESIHVGWASGIPNCVDLYIMEQDKEKAEEVIKDIEV
ncbi:DUF2007 domain-containing protein [Puteibacter caeruleilacunae]|nr:DUF2007 domain-containing protein [Puteibacter caeruleilacunae]